VPAVQFWQEDGTAGYILTLALFIRAPSGNPTLGRQTIEPIEPVSASRSHPSFVSNSPAIVSHVSNSFASIFPLEILFLAL